jgi:hypothetical protein
MVTEGVCLDVVLRLYDRKTTVDGSENQNCLSPSELYRELLGTHSLATIDDNIRWLELSGFLRRVKHGTGFILTVELWQLTPSGEAFAHSRKLDGQSRKLLYTEDPYSVFVARQFRSKDDSLYSALEGSLASAGFSAVDGKVDGVDTFRGEILRKIKKARFFVCLLTHRAELKEGLYASSVWLYQETGAAVALGKKPLLLIESGMHDHYAGELQKNYEYVAFERPSFSEKLPEVVRRLNGDLRANYIPTPRQPADLCWP